MRRARRFSSRSSSPFSPSSSSSSRVARGVRASAREVSDRAGSGLDFQAAWGRVYTRVLFDLKEGALSGAPPFLLSGRFLVRGRSPPESWLALFAREKRRSRTAPSLGLAKPARGVHASPQSSRACRPSRALTPAKDRAYASHS